MFSRLNKTPRAEFLFWDEPESSTGSHSTITCRAFVNHGKKDAHVCNSPKSSKGEKRSIVGLTMEVTAVFIMHEDILVSLLVKFT